MTTHLRATSSDACVCGAQDWMREAEFRAALGDVTILRCRACGMHRDAVLPTDEELHHLYVEQSVYTAPTEDFYTKQQAAFQHVVSDLADLGIRHGSVLDVGCHSGYALKVFESCGWSVTGIEPNEATSESARQRLQGPIYADVSDLPSDARFDVMLLSHTLEHITDPVGFIRAMAERLREGGVIYVKVPNYGARYVRYVLRGRWHCFIPGQHIWYFDRSTLAGLFTAQGFTTLRTYTRQRPGFASATILKALIKAPIVAAMHLMPDEGGEVVGIFRKR